MGSCARRLACCPSLEVAAVEVVILVGALSSRCVALDQEKTISGMQGRTFLGVPDGMGVGGWRTA